MHIYVYAYLCMSISSSHASTNTKKVKWPTNNTSLFWILKTKSARKDNSLLRQCSQVAQVKGMVLFGQFRCTISTCAQFIIISSLLVGMSIGPSRKMICERFSCPMGNTNLQGEYKTVSWKSTQQQVQLCKNPNKTMALLVNVTTTMQFHSFFGKHAVPFLLCH